MSCEAFGPKERILDEMSLFRVADNGIGAWLAKETTDNAVFERLARLEDEPLPFSQLNQLLVLGHQGPVTYGFFKYYWLHVPSRHPHPVTQFPKFESRYVGAQTILSLNHLKWGLYRLYVDGLLYFGSVRTAFRILREKSFEELEQFFADKRIDSTTMSILGRTLSPTSIPKADRYLIAERACKTYGEEESSASNELWLALNHAFDATRLPSGSKIAIGDLLERALPPLESSKDDLVYAASDVLSDVVGSKEELEHILRLVSSKFQSVRHTALHNTKLYLSMLADLDVYVASSMREREHFLSMADTCEKLFHEPPLNHLNLRYFDPTLSAASGHADKGLVECLMVKCAKVLVYCAGARESYGKDAEAAMALSLGRPVIFFCETDKAVRFYRDIHPLVRLVEFETGTAVGAMITKELSVVSKLLERLFKNQMEYRLINAGNDYLRLEEVLTGSVVRVQTGDKLLTEAFWNHYHLERKSDYALKDDTTVKQLPFRIHPLPSQPSLGLGHTAQPSERLAARTSVEKFESADEPRITSRPTASAGSALSLEETFCGLGRSEAVDRTTAARLQVFTEWQQHSKVDTKECIEFLRFVDVTLRANSLGPKFVYRVSDLSRWYRQMLAGDTHGSSK